MEEAKYIDIHAHLNFQAFADDLESVLERMQEQSVAAINVGTQYDTALRARELAEEHGSLAAIVGLHPVHTEASFHDAAEVGDGGDTFTSRGEEFDYARYKELASSEKVVGIGECGLDYYRADTSYVKKQKEAFASQIALANELNKPLMLHIRTSSRKSDDAYKDALNILKSEAKVPGNVHFFAGSEGIAREFLELGYTLSFTGVITFASEYRDLVQVTPLDMMHAETDCPYIAPVPYRGQRNEPTYVKEVVRTIAEMKEKPESDVALTLRENARRLFGV